MHEKWTAARRQPGGIGGHDNGGGHRHLYSTAGESRNQPQHGKLSGIVWSKSTRASVHMLRAPKAWALDVADLDAAESKGARLVHIHDLEQLRHFWASIDTIRNKGFAFNRRHGAQIALTLEYWRQARSEAETDAMPEPEQEQEPVAVQGALW